MSFVEFLDFGSIGNNNMFLSSEIELSPFSPMTTDTYVVSETKPIMSKGGPSIVTTYDVPSVNYYGNVPNVNYYTKDLQDIIVVSETKGNKKFYGYDLYVDGLSEYAHIEINKAMRKAFLHDYLHEEYDDILNKLKVVKGKVRVAGAKEKVAKDTKETLKKKVKFIGSDILTNSKNMKVLISIVKKNKHILFADLINNPDLVANTQAKYIKKRIKEMRK